MWGECKQAILNNCNRPKSVCLGGRDGEGIFCHWKCWKGKDKNETEKEKEKKNERGEKEGMSKKKKKKDRKKRRKKNKGKAFLSVLL